MQNKNRILKGGVFQFKKWVEKQQQKKHLQLGLMHHILKQSGRDKQHNTNAH